MSRKSAVRPMASPLVLCSPTSTRRREGSMTHKDDEAVPEAPALALLSSVTSGLSMAREPRMLRQRFEEQLRTIVHARSVAVRETPPDLACPPAVVSVDLPSAPWATPARLEASFDPAQPIDDWQRRTLSMGAHLASLLMQLEQATGRWGRPRAADGAAPLIGSSAAIRSVRERIERVAATDFTVLIEGGSGPQPHAIFIDVFAQIAVDDGYWEVERAATLAAMNAP